MILRECGIPYIILEGTIEDYKSIEEKAKKLRKYDFKWYIDRIIPHIAKMIEAKSGNIDIDYFKNIILNMEYTIMDKMRKFLDRYWIFLHIVIKKQMMK